MSYIKSSVIFLLLLVFSAFDLRVSNPQTKWVISKGASLNVAGSTNVNKFSCIIANYSKSDTLKLYKNNSIESVKISGDLQLDVQDFDCHNRMMTSDLRKTLKVKEFPKLIIRFISLNKYPSFNNPSDIKGMVAIELAGVSKIFEVNYRFIPDGTRSIALLGTREVKFSDFNIAPPRKIGGMIQTDNELRVEFNLKLKVLE